MTDKTIDAPKSINAFPYWRFSIGLTILSLLPFLATLTFSSSDAGTQLTDRVLLAPIQDLLSASYLAVLINILIFTLAPLAFTGGASSWKSHRPAVFSLVFGASVMVLVTHLAGLYPGTVWAQNLELHNKWFMVLSIYFLAAPASAFAAWRETCKSKFISPPRGSA